MLSRLSSLRESGETSGYLPPPAAYNAAMNLSVGPSDVGRSQLGDGLPVGSNHDYQVSNAFRVVSSRGAVNYTVDDKVPSAENYFRWASTSCNGRAINWCSMIIDDRKDKWALF